MGGRVGDRALVLGAGMAGLFAARVLTESYAEVVLVDRDELVGVRTPRKGAPQSGQVHGLLARGQRVLDELFPGFTEEIGADGAGVGDVAGNLRWFFGGVPLARSKSGLVAITASRPHLEHRVRERVLAHPAVRLLERHEVLGLATGDGNRRVTGARVRGPGGEEELITADLVVDTTGRGSRTPVWLAELGYGRVEEDKLKIGIGYTTRHYRMPANLFGDDISINVIASPFVPRGAICGKHGDRIEVTAYSVLEDVPPTEPAAFEEYLRTLPVPDIHEVVSRAEPLDDPVPYRFPANLRRRYERLGRLPEGLVLIGDAVCSFNPTYAQGMTISALSALALREHLAAGAPRPVEFMATLSREVIDPPWELMNSADLTYPGVAGNRTLKVRIGHRWVAKVLAAATVDGAVAAAYLRVTGLIDPPEALMKPAMMVRVLRGARAAARAAAAPAPDRSPTTSDTAA